MYENIFEKHDDEFIEKINLKLKFPEFPLNKMTTGDFSRIFNERNDSFIKIFKKPFSIVTPEESTMLNQTDSSQVNINNQNINQVIENIENKLEQNIENLTEKTNEYQKQTLNIHEIVMNQFENSNSFTLEQIQELENNIIIDNRNNIQNNSFYIKNIENRIEEITKETKEEFHKFDKSMKSIQGFLNS
jgi:hypothetical protein